MNFLRNLFGKPTYQKKIGNPWTFREILKHLFTELAPLNPRLEGTTLYIADRDDFSIIFMRNRFPPKDTVVEINGSIISSDGKYIADLFHIAKPYFDNRVRPLGIYKDEAWEGSQMQKQLREFYMPFLSYITKTPHNKLTPNLVDKIVLRLKNQQTQN